MNNKIYVGNLSYNSSEIGLSDLFAQHGAVVSARIIQDRNTGRSKGFGFVEMETEEEASQAIAALNGVEFDGRSLRVNVSESKPRRDNFRY